MNYISKNLDHLGIVAATCDKIGLVEAIDNLVGVDPRSEMTVGECVKLMVINGLGFSSRPQYLEAQFYDSKPINRLLGREMVSEKITDDRLGRALDRCYKSGCTEMFGAIASQGALRFNVEKKFRCLDSTSMAVEGEYSKEEGIGLIKFGYSKDHRSDLKQFMISLVSSQDGDVPLLAQTIAGNTSDTTHFREVLSSLKDQIVEGEPLAYHVADAAMYSEKTIQEISDKIQWITRIPEKIKAAKDLITGTSVEYMKPINENYSYMEMGSNYGNIPQRWIVIHSQQAFYREEKTLTKNIKKENESILKELKSFEKKEFDCENDGINTLLTIGKKLKFHNIQIDSIETVRKKKGGKGRPKSSDEINLIYKIKGKIEECQKKIEKKKKKLGKFIIGTNELSSEKLTSEELLEHYKGQQSVERGFRFLKDPLFMTTSVFLKKQERIVALGMIMCLCLLVYTLAQRLLRKKLASESGYVKSQTGKLTQTPTLRWIFQVFEGTHVLIHQIENRVEELVLNLNSERIKILEFLGPAYQKMYENAA